MKIRGKDRLNLSRFNRVDSETLYLGSTMSNFKNRIKQHLGWGNYRTYSLHLSKWDNGLDYTLNLKVYRISNLSDKQLERGFVELVEQDIWDQCNPLFGKKSGL